MLTFQMMFFLRSADHNDSPFQEVFYFLIGIIFHLFSCFTGALGDTIMRKYHVKVSEREQWLASEVATIAPDGAFRSLCYSSDCGSTLTRPLMDAYSEQCQMPYQRQGMLLETATDTNSSMQLVANSHLDKIKGCVENASDINSVLTPIQRSSKDRKLGSVEGTIKKKSSMAAPIAATNQSTMHAFQDFSKFKIFNFDAKSFSSVGSDLGVSDDASTGTHENCEAVDRLDKPKAASIMLKPHTSVEPTAETVTVSATPPPAPPRSMWLFGLCLSAVICPLTAVVAVTFLPANVVGFAGVEIFFALVLAKWWLLEAVSNWNFAGSILALLGLVLVAINAGGETVVFSLPAFLGYFTTVEAICFVSFTVAFILFGSFFFRDRCMDDPCALYHKLRKVILPSTAGALGILAGLGAKAITLAVESIVMSKPVSFWDAVSRWRAYIIIAGTISIALVELVFLNRSLKLYSALTVISTMNIVLTVGGGLGGCLVFQDYPSDAFVWSIGLVLATVGVVVLSYGNAIVNCFRGSSDELTAL